jgi:hypothetical protein
MARVRLYPHRVADESSVDWERWWVEHHGVREALPPLLPSWDYASDVVVGVSVAFNPELLIESTGVSSLDDLEAVVIADCPSVQDRFTSAVPLHAASKSAELDLQLRLPAGRVADSVRLTGHIVTASTQAPRDDRVAYLRGARIHSSDPQRLRLEGDAGRFPTEAVAFSDLGYGNASWTVLARYQDLRESFMGSVRLLINTEHPAGQASLDPAHSARIGPVLRADTFRLLIAGAADQLDVLESEHMDEGSVGAVLESMCRMYLGQGLAATVALYRDDPVRFELVLSDRLNPFAGIAT